MMSGIRKLLAVSGGMVGLFLLILAVVTWPRKNGGLIRSCPVCQHRVFGTGCYCGQCGSKVS